jgi:hypothetical protein
MPIAQPLGSGGQQTTVDPKTGLKVAVNPPKNTTPIKTAPPAPAPGANMLTPADQAYLSAMNQANQSAVDAVSGYMLSIGLPADMVTEISSWMWGQVTGANTGNGKPATAQQVELNMYQQPFFKNRFPGIDQLGITPAQWIQQEQSYYQTASAAGMPGFVNQQQAAALIQGHVSTNELSDRLTDAYSSVQGASQDTKNALQQYYGINQNDLAKFFLDPANQVNALNQKVTAGQIGGVAQTEGFGAIGQSLAEQLAQGAFNPATATTEAQVRNQVVGPGGASAESAMLTRGSQLAGQTVSAAEALGAAMGVGVQGETLGEEQINVQHAQQERAGAGFGGGGYGTTARGTALGQASEQGAKGDVMG